MYGESLFGKNLRELRRSIGLNQWRMGIALGYSGGGFISQLETKRPPSLKFFDRLSEHLESLNIPLDEFVGLYLSSLGIEPDLLKGFVSLESFVGRLTTTPEIWMFLDSYNLDRYHETPIQDGVRKALKIGNMVRVIVEQEDTFQRLGYFFGEGPDANPPLEQHFSVYQGPPSLHHLGVILYSSAHDDQDMGGVIPIGPKSQLSFQELQREQIASIANQWSFAFRILDDRGNYQDPLLGNVARLYPKRE